MWRSKNGGGGPPTTFLPFPAGDVSPIKHPSHLSWPTAYPLYLTHENLMQPLQSAPTASGFEEIAVAQQRLLRALADIGQPGLSSPADPDTTAAGIPFSTRPQGLGAVGPLQQARPKADRRSRTRGRARERERTRAWQPAEGNNVDNGHGGWGTPRADVPLSASSIGWKSTPAR